MRELAELAVRAMTALAVFYTIKLILKSWLS